MVNNINIQEYCINKIQRSYMIAFALTNFILLGFYLFIYIGPGVKGGVSLYMQIYLITTLILWLLLYLQEKKLIFKNFNNKNYKSRLSIYLLLNILNGYNIPFLASSGYVFYFSGSRDDAKDYWFILLGLICISFLGLFLFCFSNFEMFGKKKNNFISFMGLLIILLSIIVMLHVSFIVPVESEENRTIWMGVIALLCAHLMAGRVLFYLSVLIFDIKEEGLQIN